MSLAIWASAIFIVVLSMKVIVWCYGNNWIYAPLVLYIFIYSITSFMGSVYVYIKHGMLDHRYLIMMISGIFIPLLVPLLIGPVRRVGFFQYKFSNTKRNLKHYRVKMITLFFFSIILIIASFYMLMRNFSSLPLLMLFKEGDLTGVMVSKARETIIQEQGGIFTILSLLFRLALPVMSMLLLDYHLMRRKYSTFFMFVTVFIGTIIISSASGAKALAVYYLITFFMFCRYRVSFGGKTTKLIKSGLALCLVFGGYLIFWYYKMFGSLEIAVSAFVRRFFYIYPDLAYWVYKNVGTVIPFAEGKTLPNPKRIFDFEGIFLSKLIGQGYSPDAKVSVMANTVGFIEGYANFGVLGALIWQLAFGMILHLAFLSFVNVKKTPFNVAVYSLLAVQLSLASIVFSSYFTQYYFIVLVVLWIWIVLKTGMSKTISTDRKCRQNKKVQVPPRHFHSDTAPTFSRISS